MKLWIQQRWADARRSKWLTKDFWASWFRRPTQDLTFLLLTQGHLEVRKIRISAKRLWLMKWAAVGLVVLVATAFLFSVDYLFRLPERAMLSAENTALKQELLKIQYHLDTLQVSVDRMSRFDQKLRAITEVDKSFRSMQTGVGGPDDQNDSFDFGDVQIDENVLNAEPAAEQYMDRRQYFFIQKLYAWARRIYRDAEMQEQSLEELFEVLKGRELELAAKPSILPVRGWVTSYFGFRIDPMTSQRKFHKGIDIAAREGAPVVTPADGVVTFAGYNGDYGHTVMIFHGYGITTLYAHLERIVSRVGQRVKRGDIVGTVGSSGRSTGSHLHYEVILHGVPVDPNRYILNQPI